MTNKRTKILDLDDIAEHKAYQVDERAFQSGNPEWLWLRQEEQMELEKLHKTDEERLEKAISTLPEIQQIILYIRYYLGGEDCYTVSQICEVLGGNTLI